MHELCRKMRAELDFFMLERINDIVIQMRRTSNVCPSYDLPIHLFVSTKHSGIYDVFNYINEMDTEENRTALSEILDADEIAETIDIEGNSNNSIIVW